MVVVQLRRTSRLTILTGGLGAASAAGVIAVAAIIGISLPGAQVSVSPVSHTATHGSVPDGLQLPTLALDN
jgi:hypothetical protein